MQIYQTSDFEVNFKVFIDSGAIQRIGRGLSGLDIR